MFFNQQELAKKKKYEENLKIVGSLSNLFSNANIPYLYYRIAEKLFCNAFSANDLSRGDVALDAVHEKTGIGLKTFLISNEKSFQKVAEFNKDKEYYEGKEDKEIVKIISELRNKRIKFAENLYEVDKSLYHCVVRNENEFKIFEEKMDYIDILNIINVKRKKNVITFNDQIHDYSFNISKSALSKRFLTSKSIYCFTVEILENPLEDIKTCFMQKELQLDSSFKVIDTVYLPLYGSNKTVYPKSGLNQWNAEGRKRDVNEVYIPVPAIIHKLKPNFFPSRDTPFDLKLPNGRILQSKVCQDNSKALMSYSNKELGKWILRDVLLLNEKDILTYEKLQTLGIDSVRIDKLSNDSYEINFTSIDSFENFIME